MSERAALKRIYKSKVAMDAIIVFIQMKEKRSSAPWLKNKLSKLKHSPKQMTQMLCYAMNIFLS